ncbi:MAG: nucleoside 2-deoxyribosyltransferase domain-containing protein [Polyangiaceae bacterium]
MSASIFLAGPTPRSADTPSWRPEALRLLEARGFDGVVFVPEFKDGFWRGNYDDQVGWEEEALNQADCVLFWVPRNLDTMPAFTTNDEWGWWKGSGKVVFGAPENAEKIRYQQWWAEHLAVPHATTLEATIDHALSMIGQRQPGDLREGAETQIPLVVWRKPELQRWIQTQRKAGNSLRKARLLWTHRVGPQRDIVFFWALHVVVYVAAEDRLKKNEILVGRADMSATVLYNKGATLHGTEVVLVREFRSPASTPDAFVHELPGGSSWKGGDPREVAIEEVREETGTSIVDAPLRWREVASRPLAATFSVHHGHVFACELSTDEINVLRSKIGVVQGAPDDSERTWIEIRTVGDLLAKRDVDWSTLGMILSALVGAGGPFEAG